MSALFSFFSSSSLTEELLIGNIVLTCLAIFCVLFFFFRQRTLEHKLNLFFQGKDAKTLETILTEQFHETKALDRDIQSLFDAVEQLRALGLRTIHKHAVVRFNPFKEVGSNQSFSVALLDGTNSGILLSSLHTREGTRIYAKPVEQGNANGFPFTEEEKQVIRSASSIQAVSGQ